MRKSYYSLAIISFLASLFFAISPQAYALSSCAKTFQDLTSTDAQYIPAIGCLNQKYCVVTGTQDGYLLASTQINRGEAIAFVTRYHIEVLQDGWKDVNVASLPQYFSDVPPSYGLYKEIEIARNQGFTLGYQDGTFNPTGAWTAGYQGPNRSDYNFSLVPADQQTRGGFLKSIYDKSPQYCSAPTLCTDQNSGGRPNGLCSNNYGCKRAQSFYSSTPDCLTPIQQPTYVQDNSCGPVAGGDNSACPAATPTPTAAPLSCPDICSRNYGCTKTGTYTVSNNDCNTTPIFVQAPTYYSNASTASCGTVVTDPATGAKDINDPKNAACKALTPTPAAATPTTAPSDGTTCSDIANANGYVKMAYTPTATGTYTVWTRMIGASATSSIYLQIGDQCNVIVGGAGISTTDWQWVNYRDGNATSKITVALEQGKNYTIHVAGRDSGVKVDLVKLDNTGCAQLEGIDGHCAAVPTNTPTPAAPTATPTPYQISRKLSGKIFVDTNANGTADSGESGYTTPFKVYLYGTKIDNQLWNDETMTDSSGNYSFNLPPSLISYEVGMASVPDGYKTTYPNNPQSESLHIKFVQWYHDAVKPDCSVSPTGPPDCTTSVAIGGANFGIAEDTFTINGKVVGAAANTSSTTYIVLADNQATQRNYVMGLKADGSYSLPKLPKGIYKVYFGKIENNVPTNITSLVYTLTFANPNGFSGGECSIAPSGTSAVCTASSIDNVNFTVDSTPTPTVALPTNTPAPTNTPVPNGTQLDMQFILHAIGAGGDNSNQSGGGGNKNPLDAQRDLTVQVYNTANQLVLEKTGKITFYNPQIGIPEITIGSFHGIIDLGTSITTGDYIIKVKTPFYLRKAFPITQHLVSGEVNQIAALTLVAGDIDNNNQIDLFDYQVLSNCYGDFTTPNPALCSAAQKKAADINNDGNVNYIDLNYFIRELAVQAGDTTQ